MAIPIQYGNTGGKNWPSYRVLGSVQYIWNVEIFSMEPKKKVFLHMLYDKTFHLETASTNMTYGSFYQGRELTAIEFNFLAALSSSRSLVVCQLVGGVCEKVTFRL